MKTLHKNDILIYVIKNYIFRRKKYDDCYTDFIIFFLVTVNIIVIIMLIEDTSYNYALLAVLCIVSVIVIWGVYYFFLDIGLKSDEEAIKAQEEIVELTIEKKKTSYEMYLSLLEKNLSRDKNIIESISEARKLIDANKISEVDMDKILKVKNK